MVVGLLVAGCQLPFTQAVGDLSGLALYAPLDESGGLTAKDLGPNQLTGTISPSGVTYGVMDALAANNAEQRALQLARGSGWVRFPHSDGFNLTNTRGRQWMVMLDARVDVTGGYPLLVSKGDWRTNGWALFADPSRDAIGLIIDGKQYAWGGAGLDTMKNVAVDWDGNRLRFFVNGTVLGESPMAAEQVTDTGPLSIGGKGGVTVSKVVITGRSAQEDISAMVAALGQEASWATGVPGSGTAAESTTTTAPAWSTSSPTGSAAPTTTAAPTPTTTTPPSGTANGARLLWSDEFNAPAGTGVDTGNWEQQVGAPTNAGRYEYDTGGTRNVAADGQGNLVITARRESYGGRSFTSGRIESKTSFTTGYLEFRAKVPTWSGTAPGLWTYGADGYGSISGYSEIDALEVNTANDPTCAHQTIHGLMADHANLWQLGWSQNRPCFDPARPGDAWHTYGAYVDPADHSVTFYVDGIARAHYAPGQQPSGSWPYGVFAQKVVIDLELGLYSGYPTSDRNSDTLQVDYVRVYDRPPF